MSLVEVQSLPASHKADILVTISDGQPLLVVEVKRRSLNRNDWKQLEAYSRQTGAAFVMGVDPEYIQVVPTENGGRPLWTASVKLETSSILRPYTADNSALDQIEGFYLESLVQAWLQDFSVSWKTEEPPGYEELEQIGLASRLRHSQTHA